MLLTACLAVLEGELGKSFKRKSDLGEHWFIGHKIIVLALSLLK